MPYSLDWHLNGIVIHGATWDKLTLHEAREASDVAMELIDSGNAPVHLIVDMTKPLSIPLSKHAIVNMLNYLGHPNMGWLVMIGGTPITHLMLKAASYLFQFNMQYVASFEDAMQFLRELDNRL